MIFCSHISIVVSYILFPIVFISALSYHLSLAFLSSQNSRKRLRKRKMRKRKHLVEQRKQQQMKRRRMKTTMEEEQVPPWRS